MPRPTVLVVDTVEARRKEISRGLAELGYEVVAAENSATGMRFATGLHPRVIFAGKDVEGFGDGTVLRFLTPDPATGGLSQLVLLAEGEGHEEEALGEEVVVVDVSGLTHAGVVRKLRTYLTALELGLATDARLDSVVGDLNTLPLFELLPQLQKLVLTGRVVLPEGELAVHEGQVIAARCGLLTGRKAFARLARIAGGTYRVLVGPHGATTEFGEDLLTLMAQSMEDQHRWSEGLTRVGDLGCQLKVEMGTGFFSTPFTPLQQHILQFAQAGKTIRAAVEASSALDGEVLEGLADLVAKGFVRLLEPEVKVRILTDSTADLHPEVAREAGIHTLPLSVIFGEEIFKDGVDLTPANFYKLLQERKDTHPRTSPPSKGEFLTEYRRLLATGSDVVSLHISGKMSLTVTHAREAVQELASELSVEREDGTRPCIEVIDSLQTSTPLGMLCLFAARMAQRGLAAKEIRARLESFIPRLHFLFVVDTLEYLARGGRIGKARALLGGLLGIKPILGVVQGEVTPIDRVRGGKAAHPKVVELLKQRLNPEEPVFLTIGHAMAPVWADRLRGLLEETFKVQESFLAEIGPVVGTHVGPGCVGCALFQPTPEELPLIVSRQAEEEGAAAAVLSGPGA